MKNILGIILIIGAIALGYMGINKITNSGESVEILGVELSASNEEQKTTGYIYTGLAVVLFFGGISLAKNK